ncbi:MAG TPA: hypothetical protein VLB44_10655 [Kofleriaceae bacterium]|nr:hypothetical protein [Kofleriaceae bacterium]
METIPGNETTQTIDPDILGEEGSSLRQKLGSVRRHIKQIDLREKIIDYPFAAVGIGLAAGALVGLVRPKPRPGRVTSALVTVAGAIVFRLIRDAAIAQIGAFAKDQLREQFGRHEEEPDASTAGTGARFAPPF